MDQFIQVYEKAFNDDFCNKIIKIFDMAEEVGQVEDRQSSGEASKLDKEDLILYIPSYPLQNISKDLMIEFNSVFWGNCYAHYADKYAILKTCEKHNSYTIKIQKTKPGQGYHAWHCESDGRGYSNRLLTWTVYLNDDFEAGETEFLYQQYRYKPSKGDCVIFPAAFTHTHRGNPPIGGDKYIITGWIEF
jgi:hypothetical protein